MDFGRTIRCYEQLIDWMNGISKHNLIDDECCPDFSCCVNTLKDNQDTKRLFYKNFMENHIDVIRNYKIKKILKEK